jgi:hypothetical protein
MKNATTPMTHIKSLVIGSVADGNVNDTMQALAKLCVTDDLLCGERRDIKRQAAELLRDTRLDREWTVNEPIVTCKDIEDTKYKGYRE